MRINFVGLNCESCGVIFNKSAETQAGLSAAVHAAGWISFDGKDFCPECAVKLGMVTPPKIRHKFSIEVEPVESVQNEIHVQLSGIGCYIPDTKLRGDSKWSDRVRLILDRDRLILLAKRIQEFVDKE